MVRGNSRDRLVDAALASFATRGYDATSLDDLGRELGVRKQTILYYFPSKEALLAGVIERSASELINELERTLSRASDGWAKVEAVVRKVFRLAARRPELLGLLREVSRLGPPASRWLIERLDPLVRRARAFLSQEIAAGRLRDHDPSVVLLTAYSMVMGVATEVEVQRALGMEPTERQEPSGMGMSLRALVRRRRAIEAFLRSALVTES